MFFWPILGIIIFLLFLTLLNDIMKNIGNEYRLSNLFKKYLYKAWKFIFPPGAFPRYKKENKMETNYEKAMGLKAEYEELKMQLEKLKSRMIVVKTEAKKELNWIMDDNVDE